MADQKNYQSGDITQGALFVNKWKKHPDAPNFRGNLTLSKALLKELVEKVKAGEPAKLSLSVWNRKAASGLEFMSISGQMYVEYKKEKDDDIEVPF